MVHSPGNNAEAYKPMATVTIGQKEAPKPASTGFSLKKGLGEAIVHSFVEHHGQRKKEKQARESERGLNFQAQGIAWIMDGLGGNDNRKGFVEPVKPILNAAGETIGVERPQEALQRLARQEYMAMREAMFGTPPTEEQLKDPKVKRKASEQDRQVYRRIRQWHARVAEADKSSRTLTVGMARDKVTGDMTVQLGASVVDDVRKWVTQAFGGAARIPAQLEAALLRGRTAVRGEATATDTTAGTEQPAGVGTERSRFGRARETLASHADSFGRMTLSTAIGGLLEANHQMSLITQPILNTLTSAMDGSPANILAARAALGRLKTISGALEGFGLNVTGQVEGRLKMPGFVDAFMRMTKGVEDRYLMDSPEARLAILEDMGRSYKTEESVRKMANAAARHQAEAILVKAGLFTVGRGLRLPVRGLQALFRTEGYKARKAARETARGARQAAVQGELASASGYTQGLTYQQERAANPYIGNEAVRTAATNLAETDAELIRLIQQANTPEATAAEAPRDVLAEGVRAEINRYADIVHDSNLSEEARNSFVDTIRTRFNNAGVDAFNARMDVLNTPPTPTQEVPAETLAVAQLMVPIMEAIRTNTLNEDQLAEVRAQVEQQYPESLAQFDQVVAESRQNALNAASTDSVPAVETPPVDELAGILEPIGAAIAAGTLDEEALEAARERVRQLDPARLPEFEEAVADARQGAQDAAGAASTLDKTPEETE